MDSVGAKGDGFKPAARASDEPFACPACGQMLAPTVRVCVACGQPVDFSRVHRTATATARAESTPEAAPVLLEPVRFPWPTFFLVLLCWLLTASLAQRLLGAERGQWLLAGVVLVTSGWVFFDAQGKGVPKPLRWVVASLLVWIVAFPWYLARRRRPQAPCPFMEAEGIRFARLLLVALLALFLLGVVIALVKGPPAT